MTSSTSANLAESILDVSLLPRWDLSRAFGASSLSDPSIAAQFEAFDNDAKEFFQAYNGALTQNLKASVLRYNDLRERETDLGNFMEAIIAVKSDDDEVNRLASSFNAQLAHISGSYLDFFDLELLDLDESLIAKEVAESSEMKCFAEYFRKVRQSKPHVLSKEVERALTLREPWAGASSVSLAYQRELTSALYNWTHPITGETEQLNESKLLSFFYDPNWRVRRAANALFNKGLQENAITKFSALSLNMVAGARTIENKERKYKTLRSFRNLANDVEDSVVDALIAAGSTTGVDLNRRFYELKKRIMLKKTDLKEFAFCDRNAPLGLTGDKKRMYQWTECVSMVSESFREFSPVFADIFDRLIRENRIDAVVDKSKRGGAFCILGTKKSGALELVNYLGRFEDVTTVAHESGHAVHGVLAQAQPALLQNPSLAVTETASIFGEMLVFQKVLRGITSPEEKLEQIMTKVGDIMNTVVRQLTFDRFEQLVHERRKSGILAVKEFSDFWMETTQLFYGKEGDIFDDLTNLENLWSYVPHFHGSPFYVYSYAFADLVVGSLYKVYKDQSVENFQDKFIDFLKAGGSLPITQLLKPFNLDATSPEFWTAALEGYIGPLLAEAEELANSLGL